jgi:GH24 family phage-related lysozyme (muramidase)
MRMIVFAALLCAALLVGCGGGASPPRAVHPATTSTPRVAQAESCAATRSTEPPCAAIHPEGSSGLTATYVVGLPPLTLTGSAIKVDDFGAEHTAAFENVRKSKYCPEPDPAYGWAIPTRAFGETGRGITRFSHCISYSEAVRNLRYLLDADYCYPLRSMGVDFSALQTDALCDLSYNVGPGSLCCTLRGLLQRHAWSSAAVYIRKYSYANGEFLSGLYARRVQEGGWLLHAEHPETPAQRAARIHRERETKLHNDYRYRSRLNRSLAARHCLHGYKGFSRSHQHFCNVERAHHAAVNRDIKRLHSLGIR